MASKKSIKTLNARTIEVWSGFDQSGFGDGSVCRLPAYLQAEVSSISNVDVSERKSAVQNTMNELVKAYNQVHNTNIDYSKMDFQSGQHEVACDFVELPAQTTPAQAQAVAQIPATADTSAILPQVATQPQPVVPKPVIVANPQVLAWIKTAITANTEPVVIREQLIQAGNSEEVADFHIKTAGL